jgi:hypothetical protein
MQLRRTSPSELLAGICGVALLVALFLPWFDGADAWQALTTVDVALALIAAGAVALTIISATSSKTDAPITAAALVAIGGVIATVLVLYRLLDPPGGSSRDVGLFVGLAAAIGVAVGSWRAMADERT